MSELLQSVDERTQLAGNNRMEVLLFSLGKDADSGREEVYGINVFKVREVMHAPDIVRTPNMPDFVEGMVSLRGSTIPVINLVKYCQVADAEKPEIMMITEYNRHVQGFLVHSVDSIQRLAWEDVKAPPKLSSDPRQGLVTAVTDIPGKGLVMILDMEKLLSEMDDSSANDVLFDDIPSLEDRDLTVLYVDDSTIARSQIKRALDKMKVKHISANNGQEAWEKLNSLVTDDANGDEGKTGQIGLVLTDVEMPEMDGYVLTRKIKGDSRFENIPVVMHSSLSGEANKSIGVTVGADAYVAKFEPLELAKTLVKVLSDDNADGVSP